MDCSVSRAKAFLQTGIMYATKDTEIESNQSKMNDMKNVISSFSEKSVWANIFRKFPLKS